MKKNRKMTILIASICIVVLAVVLLIFIANGGLSRVFENDKFKKDYTGNTRPKANKLENILITSYLVPLYDDDMMEQQMKYMKDANIDLVTHIYYSDRFIAEEHTKEKYMKAAEVAAKYGLKVLVRDTRVQKFINSSDEEIVDVINEYKDVPGVGGYYIIDEPRNANPYARVTRLIRENDPDAYSDVNFMPHFGYSSFDVWEKQLRDYCMLLQDKKDFLSFDVYTFSEEKDSNNEPNMFNDYEVMRQVGLDSGLNTAVYVQALGIEGHYRRPDIHVLRYNMMAALAYGFKQLKFFCWATPPKHEGNNTLAIMDYEGNPTDLYEPISKVNKQIHTIGSRLANLDALEIYHSGERQNGVTYKSFPKNLFIQPVGSTYAIASLMEDRDTGRNYMMIVNKDFVNSQTVKFEIDGIDWLKEISNETGKEIDANFKKNIFTGKSTLAKTLLPGEGALFVFEEGINVIGSLEQKEETDDANINMLKSATITASSSYGDDGFYLANLIDGELFPTTDSKGYMGYDKKDSQQWVMFDFGTNKEFNEFVVHPAGNETRSEFFPKSFKVLVSEDNVNWAEIASKQDITSPFREGIKLNFEKTSARYIKFVVPELIRNKYGFVYEVSEIEVFNR